MKRHRKPYGCTYPKCHKRFGAKSDWKRHENSQHFQLEAFRCARELPTGVTCGELLHRQEAFKNHLETQHKVSPEALQEQIKLSRIGKNCQGSFWCGFCRVVIQLKNRRNAAWDERFDHIAHHFEKEKKSIDEWVCAEENRLKKDLLKEMDRYVYDDEDEREKDGDDDDDDDDAAGDVDDDVPRTPPESFAQGNSRKRQASTEHIDPNRASKEKRRRTATNRYCVRIPITSSITFANAFSAHARMVRIVRCKHLA
jgi:hypothetical protein